MTRRYSTRGDQNVAAGPTASILGLESAATIRPAIYDLVFGSSQSPADNAIQWLLQRFTGSGTGTAVVEMPLDPNDPASLLATSKSNHTAEPTYTSAEILLDIVANQRSTQRWVAAPGSELKMPATANNGLGLQPVHSSFTGLVECTILHVE